MNFDTQGMLILITDNTKYAHYFNENNFWSNYWTANALTVIGMNFDAQGMLILITDNTKYAQRKHFFQQRPDS